MANTVQRSDLLIPQGSTYKHTFHYRDDNDAVVSLNGYTARMQIRETVGAAAALYTSISGHFVIDGPLGDVVLEIPEAITAAWTWTRGVYDIEIIAADLKVTRLVSGKVKVSPEVTR